MPESLLVFADDWGRHPSSCQHLVGRLQATHRILWVNTVGTRQVRADAFTVKRGVEKIRNWCKGLTRVSEDMWVLDLPMLPSLGLSWTRNLNSRLATAVLNRALDRLGMLNPVVLTTLPYVTGLLRGVRRRGLIYYCTDDYSYWPGADREFLQGAEIDITRRADCVLAASRALHDKFASACSRRYFPHAADLEHFCRAQDEAVIVPEELARLARPRIGFFGLIYEKLDFALLSEVARRFRQGSLVLIGPVASCPEGFSRAPNIHMLGAKPYGDLPAYLAGLDVLLMPYVNDEMIAQSGPLKLRECLASGKPTVSIDVPDVRQYQPHVRIGRNVEEFVRAVADAVAEAPDSGAVKGRQKAVGEDTWERRAEELRGVIAGLRPAKVRARTNRSYVPYRGECG